MSLNNAKFKNTMDFDWITKNLNSCIKTLNPIVTEQNKKLDSLGSIVRIAPPKRSVVLAVDISKKDVLCLYYNKSGKIEIRMLTHSEHESFENDVVII